MQDDGEGVTEVSGLRVERSVGGEYGGDRGSKNSVEATWKQSLASSIDPD